MVEIGIMRFTQVSGGYPIHSPLSTKPQDEVTSIKNRLFFLINSRPVACQIREGVTHSGYSFLYRAWAAFKTDFTQTIDPNSPQVYCLLVSNVRIVLPCFQRGCNPFGEK